MEQIGIILLVGFWGMCVLGFYLSLMYFIVMGVHSFIMEKIKKVRSQY